MLEMSHPTRFVIAPNKYKTRKRGESMRYAVVIVTYNRIELLKECIEHVINQTHPFDKIVIVDNCSQDGTVDYLKTLEDDARFIIKFETENLGGSGGFKDGMDIASKLDCDYILMIDDDAILDKDYIYECDKYLSVNPGTAAVSGTVKTNGIIQLGHRRRISNDLMFKEVDVPEEEYNNNTFNYDLSSFCGLVVKREIILEVGLPIAEYFILFDDTEYSLRLKNYGGIVNVNKSILNHKTKIPNNTGKYVVDWKMYYSYRNRYLLAKKHFYPITVLIMRLKYDAFILNAWVKGRNDFVTMFIDARHDAIHDVLGRNEKYLPNKK